METLTEYTKKIAVAMSVKGLINIQFIVVGKTVCMLSKLIQVASCTIPVYEK